MNKRRGIKGLIKIIALLFFVAVLMILSVLFHADTIDVYGNTYHTQEEIAAGLTGNAITGNTLYIMWKYRNGVVPENLPYLKSIHVEMKSPSHIVAEITEKIPVACIESNGFAYFDDEGTVLDITEEQEVQCPLITGIACGESTLYQKVQVDSSSRQRTILSLVQLLKDHNLAASEIRFSENNEMTVYIDGVEALMGKDEYLEEKVANLNKIIPRLEGQTGTLHMEAFTGKNERVSFSPSGSHNTIDDVINPKVSEDGERSDEPVEALDETDAGMQQQEEEEAAQETVQEAQQDSSNIVPMVFDSSGTLIYNVHISSGTVVDSYENPVAGCSVTEDGNVIDAYGNIYSSQTGEWINQ